ncbi:MAG: transcription-repair coupling factor, partial [Thermodesulfobacteriota bacterium]|nr:transcription-repair coupling factor [Thermodesulfobacteriota bacterium]
QRYIGDEDSFPLDRLGGSRWSRAKKKARASIEKLSKELLDIYAKRAASSGFSFGANPVDVHEFESSFPYEETEDQVKAIEDVYEDMESKRVMDRLICGDVGYGKTEVALRASFKTVMSGKQVALLVPTTLLASQHLTTFRQRFDPWPVRVEAITSFATSAKNKHILEDLRDGKVDIIIGTHSILSDRVKFNDLGLLIVDEEHRFGVAHKERIKAMRSKIDILTLSATPIPRTLNMAISGIRDLSIIETPPLNRKSIETLILRFDDDIISQAIDRELARGGQVFFVHNRVSNIDAIAGYIKTICPGARVGVAHGQMSRRELGVVMREFIERRLNVLVSSAIIGSGIDIVNANTMIINRADRFGMADLYQLRGRVGRSKQKGYALLLIPAVGSITKDARKRLSAMKEYESLGAGFQMALRDLEIRGTGEILGSAQWGHIAAIGYELYQQMLKQAVDSLQGKEVTKEIEPEIKIGVDAYIPEEYCPDQHLRLGLYKRLSTANKDDISQITEEILDMYGPIPKPTKTLLAVSEIRDTMKRLRIRKIERADKELSLYIGHDTTISSEGLVRLRRIVSKSKGRFYQNGTVVITIEGKDILNEIFSIIYSLS